MPTARQPGAPGSENATPWQQLTASVVTAAGFDLEDFTVTTAGSTRLVRVIVDCDGGVSLDDAAELSRQLAAAYDEADTTNPTAPLTGTGPYNLEVSSCGIGRPLQLPRHYRRATGRLVRLETGGHSVHGRVLGITATGVDLLVGPQGLPARHIRFDEISKGIVQVEFGQPSPAHLAALAADPRGSAAAATLAAAAKVYDQADDEGEQL